MATALDRNRKSRRNAEAMDRDELLQAYTTMLLIRRFEEKAGQLYGMGLIGGFLHLYIGQEAVAVGCCSLMGKDDHVITAYRDHGHADRGRHGAQPAHGGALREGDRLLSKGKGGSMHFFTRPASYWGGHGIVGGQVPLGTGLAYALSTRA